MKTHALLLLGLVQEGDVESAAGFAKFALENALASGPIPVRTLLVDPAGLAARRYDAGPGTAYLMRPDQLVAARWRRLDLRAVRAALARATATEMP